MTIDFFTEDLRSKGIKVLLSECPQLGIKHIPSRLPSIKIVTSKSIFNYLQGIYDMDTVDLIEEFFVIYMNRANHTIAWVKLSQGGFSGTVADPKVVLIYGLLIGAVSLILSHNHPSGNIQPSKSDIKLTRKMKIGGDAVDMQVLDHIIFTRDKYYSFSDEGIM